MIGDEYYIKKQKIQGMIKIPINSRILTAPVLIPNTPDCTYNQGEPVLSEEKVRQLATSFNKYGIIDYEHQFNRKNTDGYHKQVGSVIDSWLIPEEETIKGLDGVTRKYPKGTWFLSTRITDPETIKRFDTGEIKGFSSTTVNKNFADSVATKSKTLIKDIKDPVVMTVSVTSSPCVGGAKFCKLAYKHKSINEKDNMENETVFKKIGNFFLSLQDEEEASADKSEEKVEETQEPEPQQEPEKQPEEEKEEVEESAEKADDTTKDNNKPQNDDTKSNDTVSSDDFKALQDRVSALEKQVQTLLDKSSGDSTDDSKNGDSQSQQKTANKSKQLDVPDINSTHSGSISSTNAVYKAMGRTRFGRIKQQ